MTTRPTAPSDPNAGPDWVNEVRTNHPHLLSLRNHITRLRSGGAAGTIESGQIWTALPRFAIVSITNTATGEKCIGRITESGHWEPTPNEQPGPEVMKLFYTPHAVVPVHPDKGRPGILLSEPGRGAATLARAGRDHDERRAPGDPGAS